MTLVAWSTIFRNTIVKHLSRFTWHTYTLYILSVQTKVPKARNFRFETLWVEHPGFIEVFQQACSLPSKARDCSRTYLPKSVTLEGAFKIWSRNPSRLSLLVFIVRNLVVDLMDVLPPSIKRCLNLAQICMYLNMI